ncbi:hypothetical protein AKO1_015591 [Acrasis kona]|uniref:Beta-casein n=1 Tax=Acrasis kona TaxID=1008807 RepID=A0AAW2ZHF3_9EUKA
MISSDSHHRQIISPIPVYPHGHNFNNFATAPPIDIQQELEEARTPTAPPISQLSEVFSPLIQPVESAPPITEIEKESAPPIEQLHQLEPQHLYHVPFPQPKVDFICSEPKMNPEFLEANNKLFFY